MASPRNRYPGKLGLVVEAGGIDLLLIDGDPLTDIKLIADPYKNLKIIIMRDGRILHAEIGPTLVTSANGLKVYDGDREYIDAVAGLWRASQLFRPVCGWVGGCIEASIRARSTARATGCCSSWR